MRSAALAEEVRETLQTYVPNASFKTASDMLNKTNVCIIAGIPGIGKTTLARVLVAEYLTVKFELIEIYDAEEADRVWDDSVPQLFYFDDFLGEATLTGKAKSNEGSALLRLLKRISKAPNKKIILTTREYILAQAQQRSERLAQHNFSPLTCTLDLENYTSVIRAEMLYNHVFHSEIPPDNKAAFALPHIYLPIISHRNFNPRLIALSLEIDNAEAEEPADTASRVLDNLEDPARIWEHIVENQLGNAEVDVLIVLFSLPLVARDDLFEAWFAYRDSNSELDGDRQFRRALKTLDGSMVRATQLRDIPALRGHAGDDHGPSAFIDAGLLASHHDIGLDHLVPQALSLSGSLTVGVRTGLLAQCTRAAPGGSTRQRTTSPRKPGRSRLSSSWPLGVVWDLRRVPVSVPPVGQPDNRSGVPPYQKFRPHGVSRCVAHQVVGDQQQRPPIPGQVVG